MYVVKYETYGGRLVLASAGGAFSSRADAERYVAELLALPDVARAWIEHV